jgi:HK97 family phage portal protein
LKILGYDITIRKAAPATLQPIYRQSFLSWWGGPHEPFTGAWQQNITADPQTSILAFSAVYCCMTGIAGDISKMRLKLARDEGGIWTEITENSPWLPVLRTPNHYQNRIQFVSDWIVSKLRSGAAYILKERDARGVVNALYVLDPAKVCPLVADNGDVYYRLTEDPLSHVDETLSLVKEAIVIPARDIIHDRMTPLWHPLVGVPPLYACAFSTTLGNKIQSNSTTFFANLSRPGGMLVAPGHISDEAAARLKATWETNYAGGNLGKIAVVSDGLTFQPFAVPAEQAQLIDQLRWTVEDVARAFHYPLWKLGGDMPAYANGPEAVTTMYYTDCLQTLIENLETCLDHGLELPPGQGVELDLDDLVRMDTAALYQSNNMGVGGGWLSPDEARFRANKKPTAGGSTPYLQQQNYSLSALAKRDAQPDPFGSARPPAPPPGAVTGDSASSADTEPRTAMQYRDVFAEGAAYERGDVVTFQGSAWHCQAATTARPGTNADWRLMMKGWKR